MLVHGLAMTTGATRELAYRAADGLEISLLWPVDDTRVLVQVTDTRSDESFELSVEADRALDAFHHPYAYADQA